MYLRANALKAHFDRRDTSVAQDLDNFTLDFGRVRQIVDYQLTNIRLYCYCTKSQQRFLETGDFIIHLLYLLQLHIRKASME